MELAPLLLTFKLAFITTVLLFIIAMPICYWLAYTSSKLKPLVEALVSMPLVLPPTVLGFYFLMFLSPNTMLGSWLQNTWNISLLFSFQGLVVASIIYSLPFMVQPIQAGLTALPKSYVETAQLMGKSKFSILYKVLLPNTKQALLSGWVLTFAHTIGEFGVVLMIGGNIPGKTKVASITIYDEVEALNYSSANYYSLILLSISFLILLTTYTSKHSVFKKWVK